MNFALTGHAFPPVRHQNRCSNSIITWERSLNIWGVVYFHNWAAHSRKPPNLLGNYSRAIISNIILPTNNNSSKNFSEVIKSMALENLQSFFRLLEGGSSFLGSLGPRLILMMKFPFPFTFVLCIINISYNLANIEYIFCHFESFFRHFFYIEGSKP